MVLMDQVRRLHQRRLQRPDDELERPDSRLVDWDVPPAESCRVADLELRLSDARVHAQQLEGRAREASISARFAREAVVQLARQYDEAVSVIAARHLGRTAQSDR